MARKTYGHSDETYRAIVDHEADIAKEMECDPTYIYGIKNRSNPDPYPKFRELYRATAHAGGETSFWRNDLNAIDATARPVDRSAELTVHLLAKIGTDADSTAEIYKAIEDGTVDERECHRLLNVMANVRQNEEQITNTLLKRLSEINDGRQTLRSIG